MHYLPTEVSPQKIKTLRIISVINLLLLATVFSGWVKEFGSISRLFLLLQTGLNQVYKLGSIFFGITAIAIVILYSYREEEINKQSSWIRRAIGYICNIIAPYTFMFYLWHSGLLIQLAQKLTIENTSVHYFSMLTIGFIITAYIAYLMTHMNNGITKHILQK